MTYVEISEQVLIQNQEGVLHQEALRLGQALRETEDQLISSMISSSLSHIPATEGNNGDTPTEITTADNNAITTSLINANGHMFLSSIEGSDKFGTTPVRKAFVAMCNSALIPSIQRMSDFTSVSNYGNDKTVMDGEWGAVNNARFLVSTLGPVRRNSSADGNDVYEITYCAKEGYGVIDQQGGEARAIYHGPEFSGPLEQTCTLATKFAQAVRLLNESWVIVLDVTL